MSNILNYVEDKYVLEGLPKNEHYYSSKKSSYKRWKSIAAAILILFAIGGITPVLVSGTTWGESILSYVKDDFFYSGEYDGYSDKHNLIEKNNGMTVTLSEVYCDGLNLMVAYKIESKEPFSEYKSSAASTLTQYEYDAIYAMSYEEQVVALKDWGMAGLEGHFVDENTFVGTEVFLQMDGSEFPEEFELSIMIGALSSTAEMKWRPEKTYGSWSFNVPVKCNKEEVYTLYPEVQKDGYSIDRVVVSPIAVTVFTSYPDIYEDSLDYGVAGFSDVNPTDLVFQAIYDRTSGFSKIPRRYVGDSLRIYVLDDSLILEGYNRVVEEDMKKCAIIEWELDMTELEGK